MIIFSKKKFTRFVPSRLLQLIIVGAIVVAVAVSVSTPLSIFLSQSSRKLHFFIRRKEKKNSIHF